MQIMITQGALSRTRVFCISRWQLVVVVSLVTLTFTLVAALLYHLVFLKAARERWPVVGDIVSWVVRDEFAQRDRYMQDNLDAMARRLGDMQARMVRIEAMRDRVAGLAGIAPGAAASAASSAGSGVGPSGPPSIGTASHTTGGEGGPYVPWSHPTLRQLHDALGGLERSADHNIDLLTLAESRLFESRLDARMVPSSAPVNGPVGSGFGFRSDPFSGRSALHTGLDFPSPVGTEIHAAAGGIVLSAGVHPEYGNLLEIDHGNGLVTRYAHTSKILVRPGDLVRRGQLVALVGSTGRSTGPHLHFEVLVDGVQQNPLRFLGQAVASSAVRAGGAD